MFSESPMSLRTIARKERKTAKKVPKGSKLG